MKLLSSSIGMLLDIVVAPSTTDDDQQPRYRAAQHDDEQSSSTILWAAELDKGIRIFLVNDRPLLLLEVRSFTDRSEALGNVAIAKRLEALGILREESAEAKRALPLEISDEFAQKGERTGHPRGPEQLSLFAHLSG